jgi:hypothetical protein
MLGIFSYITLALPFTVDPSPSVYHEVKKKKEPFSKGMP